MIKINERSYVSIDTKTKEKVAPSLFIIGQKL